MPPLPESSWLDAFCPLAPASAVGFPFLGGATSVHVCVPHDGSRGGLIVVPKFLSTDETLVMTAAIEDKVNSNSTATYRRSWLNLPVGNNDRAAIKMAELPKLGSRLLQETSARPGGPSSRSKCRSPSRATAWMSTCITTATWVSTAF